MDAITKFDDLVVRGTIFEMLHRIKNVGFFRAIIAMKGESYTGKTTCAVAIAKAYNCSVVNLDRILDSFSPSSAQEADRLTDLAFDIVLGIARLQLEIGRPVVVDSPLTKRNHLEKLVAVAEEFYCCRDEESNMPSARFIIVECKPGTRYTWEKRFDGRDKATHDNKWYKPKDWNDVVSDPSKDSKPELLLPHHMCWLTVDTTFFVPANYRNLGLATLDLIACENGHSRDFRNWSPHNPYHSGFNASYFVKRLSGGTQPHEAPSPLPAGPPLTSVSCGDDGRHMLEKVVTSSVEEEQCRACHIDISYLEEEAYVCTRCGLALHKSCAELDEKSTIPDPHSNLPPFLRIISSPNEFYRNIPVEEYKHKYNCSSCSEFSVNCEFCLWEMHLGLRAVPTMVYHEGRGGPVWFWITTATNYCVYRCDACKLPCFCVGYTCLGDTYLVNYHVECVLLPRLVRNVHGGHHHDMELMFGTDEQKEDYICHVCQDLILDPAAWFYYCHKCDYVSHLSCIYIQD